MLGNLLKDDGCSLNEQEKVVASKLLGQMANGMATYSKFTLLTIKQKTTKNSSIDYEHAIWKLYLNKYMFLFKTLPLKMEKKL